MEIAAGADRHSERAMSGGASAKRRNWWRNYPTSPAGHRKGGSFMAAVTSVGRVHR
jgi:hypothetical protein